MIARTSLGDLENSLRRTYNRDYPLVNALSNNEVPIPKAYKTTFEYILNADLIKCLTPGEDKHQSVGTDHRWNGALESWKLKMVTVLHDWPEKSLKNWNGLTANVKTPNAFIGWTGFPLLIKFNIEPNPAPFSKSLLWDIARDVEKGVQFLIMNGLNNSTLLGENFGLKVEGAWQKFHAIFIDTGLLRLRQMALLKQAGLPNTTNTDWSND